MGLSNRQISATIVVVTLVATALLSFQNCSGFGGTPTGVCMGGNGGGYDGMTPTGCATGGGNGGGYDGIYSHSATAVCADGSPYDNRIGLKNSIYFLIRQNCQAVAPTQVSVTVVSVNGIEYSGQTYVLDSQIPPLQLAISGSCGSANGKSFAIAPTYNLCEQGAPSHFTGSGPWTWNCSGSGGGTNASCNAQYSSTATPSPSPSPSPSPTPGTWVLGAWGTCTGSNTSCSGGATQTRTVACSNANCPNPMPATSQSCMVGVACQYTLTSVYFMPSCLPLNTVGVNHHGEACATPGAIATADWAGSDAWNNSAHPGYCTPTVTSVHIQNQYTCQGVCASGQWVTLNYSVGDGGPIVFTPTANPYNSETQGAGPYPYLKCVP